MLARERTDLRDWALFAIVAIVPAVVFGVVGYRAVRAEEAATARSLDTALDLVEVQVSELFRRELETAERSLGTEAFRAPSFARAVRFDPSANRAAAQDCSDLGSRMALAASNERAALRERLFASCKDARSPNDFYLAPLVASKLTERPSSFDLAGFVETHAATMAAGERRVLADRIDVIPWLTMPERERIEQALRGPTASLDASGLDDLRFRPPDPRGLVRQDRASMLGIVRVDASGIRRGFVVHRDSLAESLFACEGKTKSARCPFDGEMRARWPEGIALAASTTPAKHASPVVPGLFVTIDASRAALERATTRARVVFGSLWLGLLVIVAGCFAFLFRRARRAIRTSELRTDFVAAVSHELRTPAASLRMLSELLRDGKVAADEMNEVTTALALEAERLGSTVERLLRFRSLDRGKLTTKPGDLGAIATQSIDDFVSRHPGSRVERRFGTHQARFEADAIRLALDNLLQNALKYAPLGDPYIVEIEDRGGAWEISVSDRGPGIPRAAQKRIFEPFERASDKLSEAVSGFGIGLSLVRNVARAHGGKASVVSEPGKGATFTLLLPKEGP